MTKQELKDMFVETIKEYKDADNEKILAAVDSKIEKALQTEKAFKIETHDNIVDDPKGGFKRFGNFLVDVKAACDPANRSLSKELQEWERASKALEIKAAGTGLSEANANYAGFLVPEEYRNELMVLVREENPILPLCTQMPMQSNILKIPYVDGFDKSGGLVYGGIKWYWVAEEAQATESRPKVDLMQMELHTLVGLAFGTEQLIADSPRSVEALFRQGFQDGLNFVYNNVLIRGTGAGQPLGFLNAPCLVTVSAESGQDTNTPILWN